jgi:ABC-2 type transport system ATP-binding protein
MDEGRIIAGGAPDALLRERYPGLIIELPAEDVAGELGSLEHRLVAEAGVVEIVTRDVAAAIATLAREARTLNRIKIRQPTLEDLFLDLTGHSLRA